MNVKKIKRLVSRCFELGFNGMLTWGATKSYRSFFGMYYKKAALAHKANHRWSDIAKHLKRDRSFGSIFSVLASNRIFTRMLATEQFAKHFPAPLANDPTLFEYADTICRNRFSILGSDKLDLGQKLPWHYDIKLPQEQWGTEYWNRPSLRFYQEISVQDSPQSEQGYYPDIKVPWELSRLQHIFIIGYAYQRAIASNDSERITQYSDTFVKHMTSWIDENPYLLGVNWVCPMEVAIRAVNMIWGFHFFKNHPEISMDFWKKIVCSLYDHAHYLDYNRETSDKPNNHYLADLVGGFYLSVFFKDLSPVFNQKQSIVLDTIWAQIAQQVHPDGTSYEGSTNYHRLVTEMLVHVSLMCQLQGTTIPTTIGPTLRTMKAFLQDCTDLGGNLAQIGDNDSGKFVTGLRINPNTQPRLISYRYAGITIMNTHGWHVTFRHPTFDKHQPTGHFHADELSITASIDGKPLLVDPGSYLYTSNKHWRNQYRSSYAHNSFFVPAFEQEPKDLFTLPRQPYNHEPTVTIEGKTVIICDRHLKYNNRGLIAHRRLIFDTFKETLELHDWWQPSDNHQNVFNKPNSHNCVWNLHWATDLSLYQNESHAWIICRKNKPIAHLTSTLSFTKCDGFFSPSYGIQEPAITLTATHALSLQHRSIKIHRF